MSPGFTVFSTAEVIVAKQVDEIILGVDVSKQELEVYCWGTGQRRQVANEAGAIRAWLRSLTGPVALAVEATSDYHFRLVDEAHVLGLTVYVINGLQLSAYRKAVTRDHKSDPDDAWLLARYLNAERPNLRPFSPPCSKSRKLWQQIKRRAGIVEKRKDIQQSLSGTDIPHRAVLRELDRLIKRIEEDIRQLICRLGWNEDYRRCQSIPGIGKVNAAALVCAFHRAAFASSDAFVAFLGLDIRRRESGRFKGKRKLTKRGEPELRRLLYCAARPACSYAPFDQYRQRQLDKGLTKTAANMILGRKLARIAFALLNRNESFKKQEIAYC